MHSTRLARQLETQEGFFCRLAVCTDRISNCPLHRVLTYKNLIYLLNLQSYWLQLTEYWSYGIHVLVSAISFSKSTAPEDILIVL